MTPFGYDAKFLIAVHSRSKLDLIPLDIPNEESSGQSLLSYSALRNIVQSYLGVKGCNEKVMSVLNGAQAGTMYQFQVFEQSNKRNSAEREVSFYHSLVIAICSCHRHRWGCFPLSSNVPEITSHPPPVGPMNTLDLHTESFPLGQNGLDRTLEDLQLNECTRNGILQLYCVFRRMEPGENADISQTGLETVYTFRRSWVPPSLEVTNELGSPQP